MARLCRLDCITPPPTFVFDRHANNKREELAPDVEIWEDSMEIGGQIFTHWWVSHLEALLWYEKYGLSREDSFLC